MQNKMIVPLFFVNRNTPLATIMPLKIFLRKTKKEKQFEEGV